MDNNLKDVYEEIAPEFDQTRQRVWLCVRKFLNSIPKGYKGLEIGCGNGKNMLFRQDLKIEGIDFCDNFIKICHKKGLLVKQADMRNLPYKSDVYDFSFSIAVLHHLYNLEDRIKAIKEQIRVTKKGGLMMVLVWNLNDSRFRQFSKSDEMVSWKKKNGKILYRYYHLYKENELKNELSQCKDIKIKSEFIENGNSGIIFTKI